jgi:hypothetical protein
VGCGVPSIIGHINHTVVGCVLVGPLPGWSTHRPCRHLICANLLVMIMNGLSQSSIIQVNESVWCHILFLVPCVLAMEPKLIPKPHSSLESLCLLFLSKFILCSQDSICRIPGAGGHVGQHCCFTIVSEETINEILE